MEAVADLLKGELREAGWKSLQSYYDDALQTRDMNLAAKVGLAFGEMIKKDIPGFHWNLTVDDWGCARSLNFEETGISIFPENMIVKRIDDDQGLQAGTAVPHTHHGGNGDGCQCGQTADDRHQLHQRE